jgi:hypothetical protein
LFILANLLLMQVDNSIDSINLSGVTETYDHARKLRESSIFDIKILAT